MVIINSSCMVYASTKHTLGLGSKPDVEINVVLAETLREKQEKSCTGGARYLSACTYIVHFVIPD